MAHPNYIKMHIRTVPELLRDCAETMYQRVKNTLEDEKLEQTQMVVMTGCGYSYAAACNGAEFTHSFFHLLPEISALKTP